MTLDEAKRALHSWYLDNKRALPWRASRDPYRIWVSETMLQQTTTTAVIPFFERFVAKFPTLDQLAAAPEGAVVEAWAGLGYYSRARNLHKSARALVARGGFPRTFEELIELPGFGPYTARSVASLAFDQPVGVVDGNVVRVLSRVYAEDWDWWQNKVRDRLQVLADQWVADLPSHEMNQALMELGRTVCTPKVAVCLLCPLRGFCRAFAENRVLQLPKPRPRRAREIWLWTPSLHVDEDRILLAMNESIPFLKNQWLLPGVAKRVTEKPDAYHYKHSVTHHDIYVTVATEAPAPAGQVTKWVKLAEVRQHVPASLVQKAIALSGDARASSRSIRRSTPGSESASRSDRAE